jgi:hypothetical protein
MHAPSFGPHSGWYRPGTSTPGSLVEQAQMRLAALPCTVVVLRRRGARISAADLLRQEPPSGLLLALDRYTAPHWHCCLFDDSMKQELLPRLLHAQLERENEGVRLYGGLEVDRNDQWRQAWLCTPTPNRAREILVAMLEERGGTV